MEILGNLVYLDLLVPRERKEMLVWQDQTDNLESLVYGGFLERQALLDLKVIEVCQDQQVLLDQQDSRDPQAQLAHLA